MNNTVSLQQLFHDRIFRVPDYQRGYAWEDQQVTEFLDDLELLRPSRRHYTGTIILHPQPSDDYTDSEGNSYVGTHVVDGQQRLTTIVLLLNEISCLLDNGQSSRAMATGIRRKYVENRNSAGQQLRKLRLNQEDTDHFFQHGVLPDTPSVSGPPNASARRLLNAKRMIQKFLSNGGDNIPDREKYAVELHKKVTNHLHFNLYEVETAAEVGVIFEVTNDRGKSLTDLEKVKNYLLYTASALELDTKEFVRSVNDAWSTILVNLMSANLGDPAREDQLLRAHWLMAYDPHPRYWQGSKSIKIRFNLRRYKRRPKELLADLTEYVAGLRKACTCFCDVLRPDRNDAFNALRDDHSLRNGIMLEGSRLVRTGTVATFVPLLMAVRQRSTNAPKRYRDMVELCERFAFRVYRVAGRRSNYLQSDLFGLAHALDSGSRTYDDIGGTIKQMITWHEASFEQFTSAEHPQNWIGSSYLRYFLYEYELHLALAKGKSPTFPWEHFASPETIEHVLPQSIQNQRYWRERFTDEEHQRYLHDIGNLTLTNYNASLGNKPFPEKKGQRNQSSPCYANSGIFQELELTDWTNWTVREIDQRRARLLEWAKDRWRVDLKNVPSDVYQEIPMDEELEEDDIG